MVPKTTQAGDGNGPQPPWPPPLSVRPLAKTKAFNYIHSSKQHGNLRHTLAMSVTAGVRFQSLFKFQRAKTKFVSGGLRTGYVVAFGRMGDARYQSRSEWIFFPLEEKKLRHNLFSVKNVSEN